MQYSKSTTGLILCLCLSICLCLGSCGNSSATESESDLSSTATADGKAVGSSASETKNANNTDTRTLDDFIKAYEDEGISVDKDEKPYYSLIEAIDGVIFYINGSPVKIYQYKDDDAYEEAKTDCSIIADWPQNGNFVLETQNDKATEIFNSVAK